MIVSNLNNCLSLFYQQVFCSFPNEITYKIIDLCEEDLGLHFINKLSRESYMCMLFDRTDGLYGKNLIYKGISLISEDHEICKKIRRAVEGCKDVLDKSIIDSVVELTKITKEFIAHDVIINSSFHKNNMASVDSYNEQIKFHKIPKSNWSEYVKSLFIKNDWKSNCILDAMSYLDPTAQEAKDQLKSLNTLSEVSSKIQLINKEFRIEAFKRLPVILDVFLTSRKELLSQLEKIRKCRKMEKLIFYICGGEKAFQSLKVLELGPYDSTIRGEFVAIDKVRFLHDGCPVMRGLTFDNRPFIAIRHTLPQTVGTHTVTVFHQKYSSTPYTWLSPNRWLLREFGELSEITNVLYWDEPEHKCEMELLLIEKFKQLITTGSCPSKDKDISYNLLS